MSRSAYIYGRIINKLELRSFDTSKFTPTEIYDEIQQAQDAIYSRITPKKTFTVNLSENKPSYRLIRNDRRVIGAVIGTITPESWDYKLEYIFPNEWDKVLHNSFLSGQPSRFTIIDNTLHLRPIPTENEQISLIVYQLASAEVLSPTDDPELNQMWDKAMEYFVLFQYTDDPKYMELFEKEIRDKSSLEHYDYTGEIVRETTW